MLVVVDSGSLFLCPFCYNFEKSQLVYPSKTVRTSFISFKKMLVVCRAFNYCKFYCFLYFLTFVAIVHMHFGSSINDVTAIGGQRFFDDRTEALVLNSVTMGGGWREGFKKCSKLPDVIHRRPLVQIELEGILGKWYWFRDRFYTQYYSVDMVQ